MLNATGLANSGSPAASSTLRPAGTLKLLMANSPSSDAYATGGGYPPFSATYSAARERHPLLATAKNKTKLKTAAHAGRAQINLLCFIVGEEDKVRTC